MGVLELGGLFLCIPFCLAFHPKCTCQRGTTVPRYSVKKPCLAVIQFVLREISLEPTAHVKFHRPIVFGEAMISRGDQVDICGAARGFRWFFDCTPSHHALCMRAIGTKLLKTCWRDTCRELHNSRRESSETLAESWLRRRYVLGPPATPPVNLKLQVATRS